MRCANTAMSRRTCCLAAGVLAVAAVAAGCGSTTVHRSRPGTDGRRITSSPEVIAQPGLPRFFADTVDTVQGNGPLQVRDSATGRLVAQGKPMFGVPPGITALVATTGRSFVNAAPAGNDVSCVMRLYRVNLNAQGRLGRLSPLGKAVRGYVWSLAASVGGQVTGYAASGCAKGQPGYLAVLDTHTGRTRHWSDVSLAGESPGNVAMGWPFLSMSANGRVLAFAGADVAGNWHAVGYGHLTRQVVRVLPTGAAPGTVAQRSHVVLSRPLSGPELAAVAISPDGGSFYLCTRSYRQDKYVMTIAAYTTAAGGRQRVIATLPGAIIPTTCQMALDPAGRFLLVTDSLSNPQGYPGIPVLRLARIDLTMRAVAVLNIKLPRGGGMDPYAGMSTAW
jgi:hypothetical protein